jgi:hypothetical protein
MKLNRTPNPTAKVATNCGLRRCRSICRADASRPFERTKFFSRGSTTATTTVAIRVMTAMTAKPVRQPAMSAMMPGIKRPEKPPTLAPMT